MASHLGGKTGWTCQRQACSGHFKSSWLIARHWGGESESTFLKVGAPQAMQPLEPSHPMHRNGLLQQIPCPEHSWSLSLWPSFALDLKRQWNPLCNIFGIKPGRICCRLLDDSLGALNPWPFFYRMDLNGNKTVYNYGKSLGSNQAAKVVDFSMIVLGVQAPGHSSTEWT